MVILDADELVVFIDFSLMFVVSSHAVSSSHKVQNSTVSRLSQFTGYIADTTGQSLVTINPAPEDHLFARFNRSFAHVHLHDRSTGICRLMLYFYQFDQARERTDASSPRWRSQVNYWWGRSPAHTSTSGSFPVRPEDWGRRDSKLNRT